MALLFFYSNHHSAWLSYKYLLAGSIKKSSRGCGSFFSCNSCCNTALPVTVFPVVSRYAPFPYHYYEAGFMQRIPTRKQFRTGIL